MFCFLGPGPERRLGGRGSARNPESSPLKSRIMYIINSSNSYYVNSSNSHSINSNNSHYFNN